MRQANVALASGDENANVGERAVVVLAGPLVIVVSGEVVSPGVPDGAVTVHVRVAGEGSVFPAPSVARTSNVCVPVASGV